MGRKKIKIKPIVDEKTRNITFNKRKTGLLKKAAELSMLCNINVYLVFTDINGNIIHFSSPNCDIFEELIGNCQNKQVITFDQSDYPDFFKQKKQQTKQTSDPCTSSIQTEEDQIVQDNTEIQEKIEEDSETSVEDQNESFHLKKQKIKNKSTSINPLENKIKELNKYQHVTRSKFQEHLQVQQQQQQQINDRQQYQQLHQKNYNQKSFVKPKDLKITIPKQNQFLKAQMTLLKQFNLKKSQQNQKINDGPTFQQQNFSQQQQDSQISNQQQQQQHHHYKQQLLQYQGTEGGIISANSFNREQLQSNEQDNLSYQQQMNSSLLSQQNHILFSNMEKMLSFPEIQQNNLQSSNQIQNKYNLRNTSYNNKLYDMKSPDSNDILNYYQLNSNMKSGNVGINKDNFMIDRALDVRAEMYNQYNNIVSPQELINQQQQQMNNENFMALSANSAFNNNKEIYSGLQHNNNYQNNLMLQSKKIKKIKSKQF